MRIVADMQFYLSDAFLLLGCSAPSQPLAPVTAAPATAAPAPSGGGSSGGSSSGSSSGSGFCAGKANGLYPDPSNNNNFFNCNNGNTNAGHCATGLVFDASCSCCNWS